MKRVHLFHRFKERTFKRSLGKIQPVSSDLYLVAPILDLLSATAPSRSPKPIECALTVFDLPRMVVYVLHIDYRSIRSLRRETFPVTRSRLAREETAGGRQHTNESFLNATQSNRYLYLTNARCNGLSKKQWIYIGSTIVLLLLGTLAVVGNCVF